MTSPGVSHPGTIACAAARAGADGVAGAARAAPGSRIAQQPTIAAASRRPVRVVMFMVPPEVMRAGRTPVAKAQPDGTFALIDGWRAPRVAPSNLRDSHFEARAHQARGSAYSKGAASSRTHLAGYRHRLCQAAGRVSPAGVAAPASGARSGQADGYGGRPSRGRAGGPVAHAAPEFVGPGRQLEGEAAAGHPRVPEDDELRAAGRDVLNLEADARQRGCVRPLQHLTAAEIGYREHRDADLLGGAIRLVRHQVRATGREGEGVRRPGS